MSEFEWYYVKDGEKSGPCSGSTIKELASQNEINSRTLVWRAGLIEWVALSECDELSELFKNQDDAPPIPTSNAEPGERPGESNYLMRHWRGENSLVWAFWVNFVLLNISLAVITTVIFTTMPDAVYLGLGILVAALFFYVWQVVGVWRSAGNYVQKSKSSDPKKSGAWGRAAQVFLVFGVINSLANYFPALADYIAIMRNSGFDQYFIQQTAEGDLTLNGYLSYRSVREVKAAFEANENLGALILNSPGGLLAAAFDLADFVAEEGITVGARGDCVSACVLVLAAANFSAATPDTNIIFHHPETMVELRSIDGQRNAEAAIDEYYNRLERYGVPPDRFPEFKNNSMTPLTIGEAFDLSIVNVIWDEVSNEFYNPEEVCAQVDCYVRPVQIGNYTASSKFIDLAYLTPGICFDDPSDGFVSTVVGVESVSCNMPHDNEVYANIEVDLTEFPGADALAEYANSVCIESFEGFVGADFESSSLDIFTFNPTAESWELGDRTINCVLYEMNLEKLHESAQGAGRPDL